MEEHTLELECMSDRVVVSGGARDAWGKVCEERVKLIDGVFEIRDEKILYIAGEIYIAAILDGGNIKDVVIARIPRSLWCWICESDLGANDGYLSYSMQDYRERRKNEVWRGKK